MSPREARLTLFHKLSARSHWTSERKKSYWLVEFLSALIPITLFRSTPQCERDMMKMKIFSGFFGIIWSFLIIFVFFIVFWSQVFYSKWAAIINNEGTSQKARHIVKLEEKSFKKHICSAHNSFRTTRSEAREYVKIGPWTSHGDHGLAARPGKLQFEYMLDSPPRYI